MSWKWLLLTVVTCEWAALVCSIRIPRESSTSPITPSDAENNWRKQINEILMVQDKQQRELKALRIECARNRSLETATEQSENSSPVEALNAQLNVLRNTLEDIRRQSEQQSFQAHKILQLRDEIESLRENNEDQQSEALAMSVTGRENAVKSIHWLLESAKEFRTDIGELNRAMSLQRNQTQDIEHQLQGLKLSSILYADSPNNEKEEMSHIHARIDRIARTLESLTTAFAELSDKVGLLQLQMEARSFRVTTPKPAKSHNARHRGRRHRHGMEADDVTDLLLRFQGMERQLFALSSNVSTLKSKWQERSPQIGRLEDEMADASLKPRELWPSKNTTATVNRLDELQTWYHNLFRMLETWQTEYEVDMGRFQSQVDGLKLNVTQTAMQVGILRNIQVESAESIRKLNDVITRIERQFDEEFSKVSKLQSHLLNSTLERSRDLTEEIMQNNKIMALEQRLGALEAQLKRPSRYP